MSSRGPGPRRNYGELNSKPKVGEGEGTYEGQETGRAKTPWPLQPLEHVLNQNPVLHLKTGKALIERVWDLVGGSFQGTFRGLIGIYCFPQGEQ